MVVNDGDESYDTIQEKNQKKTNPRNYTPENQGLSKHFEVLLTSEKNKNPRVTPTELMDLQFS